MQKRLNNKNYNKIQKFSIRKFSFGATSVAIASYLLFMGNGAILANEVKIQEATEVSVKKDKQLEDNKKSQEKNENVNLQNIKEKLEKYIQEVEMKISQGAYANKTEESVQLVKDSLLLARNALNSNELSEVEKTYTQLITTVNTKLRNKVVEKKETNTEDTTVGKQTIGIKAKNTEKKTESNAIENTGSNDPRNGSKIENDTTFRAAVNQDPKVDFTFSIPNEKKIYLYNEEHFSLEIPVYSETGKIRYATIKKGSRQKFPNVAGTDNDLDVEFGFTATVINRDETKGVTSDASQANPAKIVITGRPNDALKKHRDYTKQETQTLNIGTRYVQVVDDQGRENLKKGMDITDPGYFYLVLKAQSKKYALRSQPTDEQITVSSLTNPTAEDLEKIKNSIQLEYSTNNEDVRLADKKGKLVEHPEEVIQSVNIVGNNIVVTFTDGSTKTKPVGEILRKNTPPTVSLPYSDSTNKNIYVYSGEETDLTFTATDESKIKNLKLRGTGTTTESNVGTGLTVGKITDSSVVAGEGSISEDKKTATIKMTGTTSLSAGQKWTSVIVAKDDNSGESASFDGNITETTNSAERQKIEGYVEFVVKNQTSKYDIKAPEGKVSTVDPLNPTADEFEKIKEKVKIEYSSLNDDANFTSKSGQVVDNQGTKISTITKDANGNLVVTYKDGSTDTKPLSEYTSLNKQPAIDAVNQAAEAKIAEINGNVNATAEEKTTAIEKVNADKTKALTAINDANLTTKTALDNAKTSGTTAISNDNPVVTKKDTAKAAIDTALREKEAAIDANNTLTTEEKNAAKADAQAKAIAAKTAVDNATTNAAVDAAKTEGTTNVGSVTPTAVAKPAAKKAVEDALNAKIAQLDGRNDLTTEEKEAAKADATARANAAKTAIDNATTNTIVENAKNTGVADVESVNPQASQKKTEAKNAVENALAEKIKEIDSNNALTDEEKAAAKKNAQAKATEAKNNIDNARTNEAVTQAKENGTTEVNSVNPQPEAKTAAKKAIEDALAKKIEAIEGNDALTDEEKAVAKQDAQAKADAAKTNIDNARTNDAVTQAKENGTTEVNSVNPQPEAKTAAKKAIEDALAKKIEAIDSNNALTDEEKAAAKQDAQAKADAAKNNIDNARTNADVETAKTNGSTEVNNVNPQPEAKTAAKKAVEDALAKKIEAIEGNDALTDEEKAAAKQDAQAKATEAKNNIDNARTNEAVTQAKDNGTTEVNSVNPQPEAKTAAKKAIEDALAEKVKAIESNDALTDEEKAAAKQDAQAKATEAKNNIDNARTNEAVTQAKDNGTTEVNNVDPQPEAKTAAKKAIEDALAEKVKVIESNNTLTDEEKAAAKQEAQAKATEAKNNIDNARTNEAVTQAKENGTTEVNNVDPQPEAKTAAKKAVEDALAEKVKAIESNDTLTDEEKAAAKQDAQAKADTAKNNIDNARTNEAVTQAKENGTTEVNNVDPQPEAKTAAKKAIEDALAKKIEAIESNNALTDEEKAEAKQDAQAKADTAKNNIDNARTNDGVTQAKDNGTTEVNNVNPQPEEKTAAKKAIEDALAKKIEAIDSNNALTDEEKAEAKQDAQAKADTAKNNIDNARTNADVETAKTNGTTEVNNVDPQPEAKTAAKKAIEDALAKKLEAIDSNNALTDEEKAAAKQDAQAKADAAKNNIDNARTNEAVTQAKDNGTTVVNSVNPQPEAKPAAKKAIDKKLAEQLKVIESTPDATNEEKQAAIDAVILKAEAAKQAIDEARTNVEIQTQQEKSMLVIDKTVLTVEDKPNARKAIDDEADAKKSAIDARIDLSEKAKEVLKQEVDEIATKAKQAINDTTKLEDVTKITKQQIAAVYSVGEVNIPAEKVIVANSTKLTDEEKTKILEAVKLVNKDALEITQDENGTITVQTPNGQKEVITPNRITKTIQDLDKPGAGNDINKPIDKVVVANPIQLTQEEKSKVIAAVKVVNSEAVVTVDEKGNIKVSTAEGKTVIIPVKELIRSKDELATLTAGNNGISKPADKLFGNPTDVKAQEKVVEKLKALNPNARFISFDENGNATIVLGDGTNATIPANDLFRTEKDAGNDISISANKVVVNNLESLTEEEKTVILEKVQAVNPGSTIIVDGKGNVIVTTPEGKTAVISSNDLVKKQADVNIVDAGNNANTPVAKTVVVNLENLTDIEKQAIAEKVKAVNPGANVVIDSKGNASVIKSDGRVLNIPSTDLIVSVGKLTKVVDTIKTPAIRKLVANKDNLTSVEKDAVKKAIEKANPGAIVVVDSHGNATVTLNGNTVTIAKDQLVKTSDQVKDKNSGDNINIDFSKVIVSDLKNITKEDKVKFQFMILGAISNVDEFDISSLNIEMDENGNAKVKSKDGKTELFVTIDENGNSVVQSKDGKTQLIVNFDDEGNATIVTNDGKVLSLSKEAIFKERPYIPQYDGNTDIKVEKAKLKLAIKQLDEFIETQINKLSVQNIKEAKELLEEAKKVLTNPKATQAEVDAMVKRIEEYILNNSSVTTNYHSENATEKEVTKDETKNELGENVSKRFNQKELPNTGTTTFGTVLPAIAALLSGVGIFAKKKKEDE